MTLEHHLNADFDLSLRPRWRPPDAGAALHRITDLAWHALFLAKHGESVLVPEPLPGDFRDYVLRCGIEVPEITVEPETRSGARLCPFGWSRRACELSRRYGSVADHPGIDTVTRVNGRRFSAGLERELFDDDHTWAVAESEPELLGVLDSLPASATGWVLKAEHGNAGLGNRRLRGGELTPGDQTFIRRTFAEDRAVVVERWRHRLLDLCATFVVDEDGSALGARLHEMVNTADGALIGSLFRSETPELDRWAATMHDAVAAIAGRLAGQGYAGPACLDAFVWDDDGVPRLRRLADLNARREMSAGPSALWRRLGSRGAAYWRFYTRRKLRLPETYPELERRLGSDAWDPSRGRGVIVTAPLWMGAERRTPAKAAVLVVGRDRDDALATDRRLRWLLERRC